MVFKEGLLVALILTKIKELLHNILVVLIAVMIGLLLVAVLLKLWEMGLGMYLLMTPQ